MKPVHCLGSILASLGILCSSTLAAEKLAPFKVDFTSAKLEKRRAERGDWKFSEGVARCTQDDALYKKNKDHGPVVWYDVPHQDVTIHFAFKPEGCKTFVFTANGKEGHVFRFVTSATGTSLRGFPPEDKDHKSIALGKPGGPKLNSGEWTDVTVELRGTKATVRIGKDYTAAVEHSSLARAKTNIGLGFSFGTLSVKDFSITP
jgi:hypothetical protein